MAASGRAVSLLSSSSASSPASSFSSLLSPSLSASSSSCPPLPTTYSSSSSSSSSSPSSSSSAKACLGSVPPSQTSVPFRNGKGISNGNGLRQRQGDLPIPAMPSSDAAHLSSALAAPTSASSAIDFLMLCQSLKTTKRTGWVNHGLKETESISDHMHRMAIMAIIGADIPGINKDKCVKMAVVHDIAEAIVGDITPSCGIPKEEKSRREKAAIDEMCNLLGGAVAAEEVKSLWLEYENNASLEASLVKDFDKVEMILQALEYETTQGKVLNDFYESTAGKFQTEVGKAWAAEIMTRRKNRIDLLNQ